MLRSEELFVRRGGDGGPVLLLLHGLGATGAVWDGLCALLPDIWPGAWVAPDLPGHGRSAPLGRRCSFGGLAAEVARLVEPGMPFAVVPSENGWRLALDQSGFGIGAPDMDGMLAAARAPVVLAAGEHDPMSPVEHLQALVPEPLVLKGLGHNAHVEDPSALRPLLERLAGS